MDDKLKIFWNLDVLVKMCRSKSDGPSLRIEETEIADKIKIYKQEIEEIKTATEEESYDTSAEMADRNIEIITKKHLQTYKNELKEKNKELNELKKEENTLYDHTYLLRENKKSQEKYIVSMQERINETTDVEIIDRYNALIAETTEKVGNLNDELEARNTSYNQVQEKISVLTEKIANLEEKIDKKKKLLEETQASLENKDNYVDKTKTEKNNKRITELENKIQNLTNRLEEIKKDPKYIESKIKDIINNQEDISKTRPYLIELLNNVINVPYINVPADNELEEELLNATQARDFFANEIDQKSYNILEAETPEKIRTEFLNERIINWQEELTKLQEKIYQIDKDKTFGYEIKAKTLAGMIERMKKESEEFQKAYDETPEVNISTKSKLKAALDEKNEDIIAAEKIATSFRMDEADDISLATRTIKIECAKLNEKIINAKDEIVAIKNRLTSKKSGLIDITSRNKDKDVLKELAQTVIDIKHRRQFAETPLEIANRLEEALGIDFVKDINNDLIEATSFIKHKDYEEFINNNEYEVVETLDNEVKIDSLEEPKRGIKVISEAIITNPSDITSSAVEETLTDEDEDESSSSKENTNGAILTEKINTINENEANSQAKTISGEEIMEIQNEEEAQVNTEEQPELNISETGSQNTKEQPTELNETLQDNQSPKETSSDNQSEQITNEEDLDEPLDIAAIVEQTPINEEQSEIKDESTSNQNELSINSMFNNENSNTNDQKDDNIITSDNLETEFDDYLNNLVSDQS